MANRPGGIPGGVPSFWAPKNLTADALTNALAASITYTPPQSAYYPVSMRGWISPITGPSPTAPFAQYDWRLPQTPNYPRDMRGWIETPSYDTGVIAVNYQLRAAIQFSPQAAQYPTSMRGWISPATIGAAVAAPFVQYNWPLPAIQNYPRDMRGWIETAQVPWLTPFNQYDWPLPKQPSYSVSLRGWTQDALRVAPAVQAPFNQYDWPLLQQLPYPGRLRGFIDFDSFGPAAFVQPPFAQYDWPLPRLPDYPHNRRGWVGRVIQAIRQPPFAQYDWPLPRYPIYYPRGWVTRAMPTIAAAVQAPFSQYDWPTPKQASYPLNMRGWVGRVIGVQAPPPPPSNQYDWPLPKAAIYPTSMVGWIDYPRYDVISLAPVVVYVSRAATYALPRQPYYPVDRRGWITQAIRVAAAVQAPFNQYDWPLPQALPYPGRLRGFIDFDSFGPAVAVQAPFNLYDWPLPRTAAQRADRGWIASFNPATISFQMGFNTYDWPLPRAAYYPYFKGGAVRVIASLVTVLEPPPTVLQPGGAGIPHTFSRKKWRELQILIAAEMAAVAKAERLTKAAKREPLLQAARAAAAAVDAAEAEGENARLDKLLLRNAEMLRRAIRAATQVKLAKETAAAIELSHAIVLRQKEDEEDEMIALLMMS